MVEWTDGITLMHEHITIDLSGVKKDEDCRLDCFEETVSELKRLYEFGVRNIVDVTNIGMGRNPKYAAKAEELSKIHILQSTGFYKEPFLPKLVYKKTVNELAELMIAEIEKNIDDFDKPADLIGEIGTSKNEMTETEKKIFEASVIAAKETKKPIYTHTTLGTYAKEQADFFLSRGFDPKKVVIGHIDLSGDLDYIKSVLDMGVIVGFDTIGKDSYFPDTRRAEFLTELEKEGYLNQIVLSMDLTRKSHLSFKGGIGYSHLFEVFIPMLREAGIREESIKLMLEDNPKRLFTDSRR